MEKQLIVSVGREFGSGGHVVAAGIAEHFGLPLLDSNILAEIAKEKNADAEYLKKYDESARSLLLSRTVNGYSNSPEEVVARLQFDYLRARADAGESFVVIGRCADYVLRDNPGLVRIFVLGDIDTKAKRTAEREGVTLEKARWLMEHNDKRRRTYHNTHCDGKWGDSRSYDITINSSRLGIEGTTDLLIKYIEAQQALR